MKNRIIWLVSVGGFVIKGATVIAMWLTVTVLVAALDWVGVKLTFRKDGLPVNPVSTDQGHKPWVRKCQTAVAGTIVFLRECERYICEAAGVKPEDMKREGARL